MASAQLSLDRELPIKRKGEKHTTKVVTVGEIVNSLYGNFPNGFFQRDATSHINAKTKTT